MTTTAPPTVRPYDPDLLTLREVAEAITAKGYPVQPQTVWRWATKGLAGVKLPVVWRGKGYATSRRCVNWFLRASSDAQVARGRGRSTQ
jgi:transposase-like protein